MSSLETEAPGLGSCPINSFKRLNANSISGIVPESGVQWERTKSLPWGAATPASTILLNVPCVRKAAEGPSKFVTTRNSPKFLTGYPKVLILCLASLKSSSKRSSLQYKALFLFHLIFPEHISSNLSDAQLSPRDP